VPLYTANAHPYQDKSDAKVVVSCVKRTEEADVMDVVTPKAAMAREREAWPGGGEGD